RGSSGTVTPEETAGAYPGDGSNGVNVLSESGIVRNDITRSFGSAAGVAEGGRRALKGRGLAMRRGAARLRLTTKLRVPGTDRGAAGLEGAAVYLWHCTPDGRYSLYSDGVTDE